jgi:hypothetical protein
MTIVLHSELDFADLGRVAHLNPSHLSHRSAA